jgi:hypothetical protein
MTAKTPLCTLLRRGGLVCQSCSIRVLVASFLALFIVSKIIVSSNGSHDLSSYPPPTEKGAFLLLLAQGDCYNTN